MFRRLAIAGLVFAGIQGVFALADRVEARANRHAAFVLDANSGSVLYADDGDALRHPASLTKMMTLYLTFETIEAGRLSMSDKLAISARAAGQAPSKLELEPGETLTVRDAIRALITKSANDVAVALAEKIGGTESNFAQLMNKRAREIGMTKTHFENASGLPNDDQVTTARDMVTLGLRLQDDFPSYYPLFATQSFTFQGKSYRNHNTLLRTFQGIDGIKTGYTRASGFNLVSSVRRGRRHVVAAVFGGSSAAARNGEMRRLLTRALARASNVKTRRPPPQFVAKLKTPPRPARRAEPKPLPAVATAPKFAPASPRQHSAVVSPAPAPAAPEAADAGPPIDVFKVKRVLVGSQPAPSPDDMTDMEARETEAADGTPDDAGVSQAAYRVAAAPARETVITKSNRGSGVIATGQPMAMLGARDAIAAQLEAEAARELSVGSTSATSSVPGAEPNADPNAMPPGRAPSSLQAQATQLTAPPARVAALPPPPQQQSGRYEIQIGAYRSIDDAQSALHATQRKTGALLSGHPSITQPATVGGKQFFRARFAGFDANDAANACTELRRQAIDCFVMTSE